MYLTEIIIKSVFALLFAAGLLYAVISTNRPKNP